MLVRTSAGRLHPAPSVMPWIRLAAIGIWVEAFAFCYWRYGLPVDREALMIWISTLLIAASIGRRPLRTVVLDWLPFALVLLLYDYVRGASQHLGGRTIWTPQIDFDRWLFFGNEPTVWLQQQLKAQDPRWWDVVVSATYMSFFLLPYVVAGIFWLRSRQEFRRWAGRFVVMSFLGLIGFIAVPAAPPWAAARCLAAQVAAHPSDPGCINTSPEFVPDGGLLGHYTPRFPGATDYVERISGRGFDKLHLTIAQALLDKGQATVDLVAAVPSLHAGITMLFVMFMWRRCRWMWRGLLLVYALLMAFALVYSAEHYVFDVICGWLLAGLVTITFGRFERRRSRLSQADRLTEPTPAPMENLCPPTETTPSSA
ncbi:MAG: phosphatase PAP2 family protein [Actinobacteria bacterium]|nr:phosphatase PAP2 family protein [Actinomycetota bacterium]